jgi:metallo-beta-lactamase family protein
MRRVDQAVRHRYGTDQEREGMKIRLCGAAGEVTGSGYLVETEKAKVLVDFGIFQGGKEADAKNPRLGPVDAAALDAVVVTHAHLDHTGRLPMLAGRSLEAPVYLTPATADFAELIIRDSANIQVSDAKRRNRRLERSGKPLVEPLYTDREAEALLPLFQPLPYNERREVAPGIEARFVDAGHILGSASLELRVREGAQERFVVFSGDIGPKGIPILRDPTPLERADLVFLESTYGDRDHRSLDATVAEFRDILGQAVRTRERVMIPAFAVGRTQLLLYFIAELIDKKEIPEIPIYLDSPMAIRANALYRKHQELFDRETQGLVRAGRIERGLKSLQNLESAEESKSINDKWDAAIIIAASGMCDAGRILHHFRHNLWRRNAAVLIVGFQAQGSLGGRLVHGAKEVRIFGEEIEVRASIHTLGGFSAHAGQSELVEWAGHLMGAKPRVVLTHGEDKPRAALKQKLKERFGIDAECPGYEEVVSLG